MSYVLNGRYGRCGGCGRVQVQEEIMPEPRGFFSAEFFQRFAPNYINPCERPCEEPPRDRCRHRGEYPMPCRRSFEDVVYKGPCAPCCHPACPDPCDDGSYAAHAFFAQSGMLAITAQEPIALRSVREYTQAVFREVDGRVFFRCNGTFLATYVINVPAANALTAQFQLRLDGDTVPGSVVNIAKTSSDSPGSISAQALVYAESGMALALISSTSATLTAPAPNATLASLTLVRVA